MYTIYLAYAPIYIHALPADMSDSKLQPNLIIYSCQCRREDYDRPKW